MYHTNFGGGGGQECEGEEDEAAWKGGLLGQGSRLIAPTKSITPFTSNAARAVSKAEVYDGPVNGFSEEVFKRVPLSDGNGMASATLINPSGDRGMTMSWPIDQMPCLTQVMRGGVGEGGGGPAGWRRVVGAHQIDSVLSPTLPLSLHTRTY